MKYSNRTLELAADVLRYVEENSREAPDARRLKGVTRAEMLDRAWAAIRSHHPDLKGEINRPYQHLCVMPEGGKAILKAFWSSATQDLRAAAEEPVNLHHLPEETRRLLHEHFLQHGHTPEVLDQVIRSGLDALKGADHA